MNYFRFTKNEKDGFVLTEKDFIIFCKQLQEQVIDKIGINGALPKEMDGTDLMMLDEFDDLLENYFTFKFLCREYCLETPDELERTAQFIADLLNLVNKNK